MLIFRKKSEMSLAKYGSEVEAQTRALSALLSKKTSVMMQNYTSWR